jgi:DNA-binding transcriptional regulator LsrR (DeoR family)
MIERFMASSRSSSIAARAYTTAQLHFAEGLSQTEIAERLSVSRSAVSRVLTEARESGIVRLELHPPMPEGLAGGTCR